MIAKIDNPDHVTSADIVVGIPSYNEADSIAVPVDVASQGLLKHFAGHSSVIFNVDNHSSDGTQAAFLGTPTKIPKIDVSTPDEVKVTRDRLRELFLTGAKDYGDLWKKVLSPDNWREVQKLKKTKYGKFYFPVMYGPACYLILPSPTGARMVIESNF